MFASPYILVLQSDSQILIQKLNANMEVQRWHPILGTNLIPILALDQASLDGNNRKRM